MQAAENFKRQENPAGFGEVPSTLQQPIQEESEDEEEVGTSQWNSFSRTLFFSPTNIRAVDRQASGHLIQSTIHELRFPDRTASHWLIKK